MEHSDESTSMDRADRLAMARKLVAALEAGDDVAAEQQLQELGVESELYQQVGKVAREVHDKIHAFLSDSGLATLAPNETSDTRRRLEHVIELTNDAAHRTLTAVERTRPHTDAILAYTADDTAGDSSDNALAATRQHAEAVRTELSEIVMAQEFQDLSGQIIKRATALVTEIEARLIELLQLAGVSAGHAEDNASVPATEHGEGPRVSGTANDSNLSDQDEVDDLLKSLGF